MAKSISITWHVADVLSLDDTLTEAQAECVLDLVQKYHNAEIGVNWEVLESYIEEVK